MDAYQAARGGRDDVALEPAALLQRMESAPFSWWHTKARVVMGSATFFDAYNALSLAFVLPILIGIWHISPHQVGALIATGYLGQLIGALAFGWLAERLGRVPSATAAVAVMSVMNLACAAAGSYQALLAWRFIQGIGVGGEMPVAAAYISELSRAQGRGRFFVLYEMIFPVGLMATGQLGVWMVPSFGWKSMFVLGAVPGLLITPLVAALPESPRWLIARGRLSEAETVVREIEAAAGDRLSPTAPAAALEAAVSEERTADPRGARRGRWSEVLSPSYRRRTLIAWALWAIAFFISNGLNNWMPSLYSTVYRLGLRDALRAASLTNVAQVAVLLVCAFCVDRVGRRNWTMVSFAAGAALLAALGLAKSQGVAGVIVLATLSYGIIGSVNAVLYLYTPEIYPTRIRAAGTGLATAWLRLASAAGPAAVGVLVVAGGVGPVFLMFAGVGAAGVLAAAGMIETRGRRLEEIAP